MMWVRFPLLAHRFLDGFYSTGVFSWEGEHILPPQIITEAAYNFSATFLTISGWCIISRDLLHLWQGLMMHYLDVVKLTS
ncbi:hypothetical protein FV246_24520 [Escherichia coli]|nr:hypothetical protein FV246_24520 [Escherichia coli]